jgi:tetratricopeptide (TPR) repeat protein
LTEATRRRVIESAEGNPLFVEQLSAMLAETPSRGEELAVPPTIQAVLAARLDRLGPGERVVLEGAAVIGREFSTESVVDLLPGPARQSARRNLDALLGKGLLRPSSTESSFRFAHVLIQDATYRAVPKERRAELHELYADGLEAVTGSRINEEQEVLGYHLEQACRYREDVGLRDARTSQLAQRAGAHLGAAGHRAVLRGDFPAADNLLSRAAGLFAADEEKRLEVLPTLGRVLVTTGALDRAASVLDDACTRLATADAPALHAHALVERGNLLFWRGGRLQESAVDAEAALAVFSDLGDEQGLAKAWELIARHRRHRGRVESQRDALARAVTHASLAGDSMREGDARHHTSWSLIDGPAPFDEVLRYSESLQEWAAATGDPLRRLDATGASTYIRAMQGDYEGAREQHAVSTRELEDHGHAIGLYSSAVLSGRVEMLAGNPETAERFFRSAYRQMLETGQRAYLPATAVRVARALLAQGRADEAGRMIETAQREVWDDGEAFQLMWRGTLARIRARQGDTEAALLELRQAEQVIARTNYLLRIAKAQLDRAEVLFARQPGEARLSADEALRLFEFKGDLASAAEARRLIATFR